MVRKNPYPIWNCIFFVAVVVMNALAQFVPLGGKRTGEISDMHHTLITPAGYAFTIWIVIYTLLAGFIVYQFRSYNGLTDSVLPLRIWFVLSCIFNIAWILLWQYQFIVLSLIAIIMLLITLAVLYLRTQKILFPTRGERWFIILPFSLYFGWICVATLINIQIALYYTDIGINLHSNELFTGVIILISGVLASFFISYRSLDGIIPLVFFWGYAAITVEQKEHTAIFLTAGILSSILLVYALWITFMRACERD